MTTKHPVGTRYMNSEIYDEATDEVVHGFQVFRQCTPDGLPTGRKSVFDGERLYGNDMAEWLRKQVISLHAHDMLSLLIRAEDVITALDGTSVENEKLVDDYRVLMGKVRGIVE